MVQSLDCQAWIYQLKSAEAVGQLWICLKSSDTLANTNSTFVMFVGAAHGRPLAKSNSAYAKRVLNELVAGNAYVAVAITEPEAGSDMRAMESRATKVGEGFSLSGQKLWNARLRQATHVVLYTLASNGKPGARTAFLLPIDHPGLQSWTNMPTD